MSLRRPFTRQQRTTIIHGMLAFVLMLVVLQLWLLTATMNAYLGGDESVIWPAAADAQPGPAAISVSDRPRAAMTPASQGSAEAGAVATLHPAYFALVMATGIVSIGCHLTGFAWLAAALFWLNILLFVCLWALTLVRVLRFRDRVVADVMHHGRSVGFFTTVAATCVLGSQTLLIGGAWHAAHGLWIAGIVLWAVATYTIFSVLTVKADKPPLAEGINGGWLVAVVAAQSVCVLGSQLAPGMERYAEQVLLFCLSMWLGGGMLYIWIISLIFYRYTFFVMQPSDLAPPYWINMGAVAISALGGATLVAAAPRSQELLPFVKGFTLLFWATATWWIPMLVILGFWRHVYRRFPLRYDPLYWGAVFPLGMYTVSTFRLAQVIDAPFLSAIPSGFIYVAVAAWSATAFGLVRHLLTRRG
jgi:tellurite resistance protein TehA-like permease